MRSYSNGQARYYWSLPDPPYLDGRTDALIIARAAVEDITQDGAGITSVKVPRAAGRDQLVPAPFPFQLFVACELRGRNGAGRRVGDLGGTGEHEGPVQRGAAGHGGIQPGPVFRAGDEHKSDGGGLALGGVGGGGVGELGRLVAAVGEGAGSPVISAAGLPVAAQPHGQSPV